MFRFPRKDRRFLRHGGGKDMKKVWKKVAKVLRALTLTLGALLLVAVIGGVVFVTMLASYLQENILPMAEVDLDGYDLERTSYLYYYDSNGEIQVLQQLYSGTDRRWASYDELPQMLIQAAVAIEDKRFYEHQGVDWITTAKACVNLLRGGADTFGGSTLTQQLVKNLYMTTDDTADDVTVQRKVLEIFRALAFERVYNKKTVLEWYLNCIYFGNGCNGVKSAAWYYFGKQLDELTIAECASLIAITNNPSLYDPYRSSLDDYRGEQLNGAQRNRRRQESVLAAMLEQGMIDESEYRTAMAQEMVFRKGEQDALDLSGAVYSWYVDTVLEDVAKALAAQDGVTAWNDTVRSHYVTLICRSGYHIYTPYSAEAQLAVDNIYTDLSNIPATQSAQQLQSAIVLIDNRSGDIVAMAGGVGEKRDFDAYDRAQAPLQIGSSVKPLTVYAPAFEKGLISPATVIADMPLRISSYGTPFPKNDSRIYGYQKTVWQGIVSSTNAVAVNTLARLGLGNSYRFASERFGLSTLTQRLETASGQILSDLDYAPLGMGALTNGVSVREVACAYACFANDGVWRQGRTFLLVLDDEGEVVLKNEQESRTVLGSSAVNYMNYCLDSAVDVGTGSAADIAGMDVAGKTGTTSGNKDRYFAGFTGYYTAAVWCGYDTPEKIVLTGSSANPAAVLWKKVMQPLHTGKKRVALYSTEGMVKVTVCLDSGLLATDSCYCDIRTDTDFCRVQEVWVYPQDAPTSHCTAHTRVDYCVDGDGVANEYCRRFAAVGALKLESRALLKLTNAQLQAILRAEGKGLSAQYLRDDYVYLVDKYGGNDSFYGFRGDVNRGLQLPYRVCTVHTRESWESYVLPPEPSESLPPSEPTTPPTLFPLPTQEEDTENTE